ncbi:hypothetical protein CRG98_019842 [Punica granatum]|uniref:Uncharacterized protein n=1 Tax=Punica granatum TaxID=22663 RepID=A0A2I0JTZ2_PUNGR|nr:hypothetical protein CRG98_019842 [Punica granatum]
MLGGITRCWRGGLFGSEPKSCLCNARRYLLRLERESSGFSPIGPFTRLEVAICCMSQSRVRQGGDAPWGSMRICREEHNSSLVMWTVIGVAAAMKLLRRCFALGVAMCLICRMGRLLVALPDISSVAVAIVVHWGCPDRAMRDSSSGVERLRIPRGRKSESAVVLAFAVLVILALRSSVSGRLSNP